MQPLAGALLCFSILVAASSCQSQPVAGLEAESGPTTSSWLTNLRNKDSERIVGAKHWDPNSLANYLVYNTARQIVGEPGNLRLAMMGTKRSSSALDSLAGVTLGKRSAAPAPEQQLISSEPIGSIRGGQLVEVPNSMGRVFSVRPAAPLDLLDYIVI